ncbi:acetyl esterase/lipase [Microbacterium sp. SLBN-154]|uniref:alpha/beta hydrolase n=1 Tax=Microbacterium sp. SLBN-154 TaxID=2768458 RepID=UPI001151F426|nr:alpha/beta hydrolase [Microbacterium sp. SLBN-154]TQK18309.1 acetyl esterase/lipase [Microbacterium sp. SLBN-154]
MPETDTDFRSLPLAELLRLLREEGEPADPRPDIDTASLRVRFPRLAGVAMRDLAIEGAEGRAVAARLYRDDTAPASGRALVWVHGGAFIGGHLDMPESHWVAMELAARGTPVLTLDYAKCLGATHFPEPSDDVLAGWRYAVAHADQLFDVPASAIALGGASAGGNLTAGVTARLRDAGDPVPAGLVLVYPVVHPNGPEASAEVDPCSRHGELALNFAGTTEALADPHAFAALGPAAGFPQTFMLVCERDELRPSGEAFARQLGDAGVPVSLRVEPGAAHGHINEPSNPTALPTVEAIADWIGGLP